MAAEPPDTEVSFARHEAAIARLSALSGKAFEDGFAALDDEARHLCATPVHHLDLARNTRLLPLSLVYEVTTVAGGNLLLKARGVGGRARRRRSEGR